MKEEQLRAAMLDQKIKEKREAGVPEKKIEAYIRGWESVDKQRAMMKRAKKK